MPQCCHVTLLFYILQLKLQCVDLHPKFFLFGICTEKTTISPSNRQSLLNRNLTHQVFEVA